VPDERQGAEVIVVSVCATHSGIGGLGEPELGADGRLHLDAAALAAFRRRATDHIAACQRGPIIAIPVAEEPQP
jgi:hypothetical protein